MISFSTFLSNSSDDGRFGASQRIQRDNDRSNLLTISRLVLRSFLEQAMVKNNRIIESDNQQLDDLLMMLEKILWHGFRASGQKSLIALRTPDLELWSAISLLSRKDVAMSETVTCVDQLDKLTTPISRIRAFLRLAMMQKKLADFFQLMVDSPRLNDFYENWALLRQEEVVGLTGALLGLVVIDCNLSLQFDHLQNRPLSVELLAYIKIPTVSTSNDLGKKELQESLDDSSTEKERRVLLDQNNYLEERVRQLQSNLQNMKTRLDQLENSESGSIAIEQNVVSFQNTPERSSRNSNHNENNFDQERDRLLAQIVEREDSLRVVQQQLEDTKKINIDLYEKLRLSEEAVRSFEKDVVRLKKHDQQERELFKSRISELECFNQTIVDKLASKDSREDSIRVELEKKCEQYTTTIGKLEAKQAEFTTIEQQLECLTRQVENMTQDVRELPFVQEELKELRGKYQAASQRAEDAEQALQELGGHLSESKLRMIELAEELRPLSDAHWAKDSDVVHCPACDDKFTISKRKHHCRMCGSIFCASCSEGRVKLPSNAKPARVCDQCFSILNTRQGAAV